MFDLGRYYRIWHPLIMRNPHSVMFEVAYCVMLYTTVLSLEFAPIVFERLRMEKPLRILHAVGIPIVILGVILSTLHQSSLGTLYLIMPNKLYPLWYTPAAAGVLLPLRHRRRPGHDHLRVLHELEVLPPATGAAAVERSGADPGGGALGLRRAAFEDLYHRGVLKLVLQPRYETWLFLLEVVVGLLLPIAMLFTRRIRESTGGLYLAAVLTVLGFITNRLNVSITGMEGAAGMHYVPKWTEMAVTAHDRGRRLRAVRPGGQVLAHLPRGRRARDTGGGVAVSGACDGTSR